MRLFNTEHRCPEFSFAGQQGIHCKRPSIVLVQALIFRCNLSRMKTDVGQTNVAISEASPEDPEALQPKINSASRRASGLKGWTNEAELLDGTRQDAELIRGIIDEPSAIFLKAVNAPGIVCCVELRVDGDRLYLGMLTVKP